MNSLFLSSSLLGFRPLLQVSCSELIRRVCWISLCWTRSRSSILLNVRRHPRSFASGSSQLSMLFCSKPSRKIRVIVMRQLTPFIERLLRRNGFARPSLHPYISKVFRLMTRNRQTRCGCVADAKTPLLRDGRGVCHKFPAFQASQISSKSPNPRHALNE